MFLGSREMKPAFEKPNANGRIRRRPFRALAVASTILVASALAVGCHKDSPKNTGHLHLRDSFQASKTWSIEIASMSDDERRAAISEINGEALFHADVYEDGLRTATGAERAALLSGAVKRLEAYRMREDGVTNGNDAQDSAVRREDSSFIVKAICEKDSVDLVEMVKWTVTDRAICEKDSGHAKDGSGKRPDWHAYAARWRGSLVSDIFNTVKPMLHEATELRHDSLLLLLTISTYVEKANQATMKNIFYDSTYVGEKIQDPRFRKRFLGIYERMKLPDGLARKEDSLELMGRLSYLQRELAWDEKMEKFAEERRAKREMANRNGSSVAGSSRHSISGSSPRGTEYNRDWYGNGIEFSGGSGRR